MSPSARKLAAALAVRLNAVVPRPIRVLVELPTPESPDEEGEAIVRVTDGTEPWGGHVISDMVTEPDRDGAESVSEVAARIVVVVLNGVQDSVSRVLRQQWPALPDGNMAMPSVRRDDRWIYLWYGPDEHAPILTIPPIALSEFDADVQANDGIL